MIGIIYVLRNDYMHDSDGNPLYKIGLTERDVEGRIKELRFTGVPVDFEVEDSFEVETDIFKTIRELEKWVHEALEEYKVNSKREFFLLPKVSKVRHLIKPFTKQIKEVFIDEEAIEEEVIDSEEPIKETKIERERKKENFRFSLANIHIGYTITFVKDETIKAKVVNDKQAVQIDKNGNEIGFPCYLTRLTKDILSNPPYNIPPKTLSGPNYWLYNGKDLTSLRSDYNE